MVSEMFVPKSEVDGCFLSVVYLSGELEGDEEDLEEHELLESLPPDEAVLAKHMADDFTYTLSSSPKASSALEGRDSRSCWQRLKFHDHFSRTDDGDDGGDDGDGDGEEDDAEGDDDDDGDDDETRMSDSMSTSTSTSRVPAEESEYERLRRMKMAENEAFLAQLGFDNSEPTCVSKVC